MTCEHSLNEAKVAHVLKVASQRANVVSAPKASLAVIVTAVLKLVRHEMVNVVVTETADQKMARLVVVNVARKELLHHVMVNVVRMVMDVVSHQCRCSSKFSTETKMA